MFERREPSPFDHSPAAAGRDGLRAGQSMAHNRICRWQVFDSAAAMEQAAAAAIAESAEASIRRTGKFSIVLTGGKTIRPIYEELRGLHTHWEAWQIFLGDERCLPDGHPERNSSMASQAWLDHVPIPTANVHLPPSELGPEQCAEHYRQTLHGAGAFDLVLLGLGQDGHVASLFPDRSWGDEPSAPSVLVVRDAPKPPPDRVSLSARRLSEARRAIFVVAGRDKQQAVQAWREGRPLPASSITPTDGVDVFLDREAWA